MTTHPSTDPATAGRAEPVRDAAPVPDAASDRAAAGDTTPVPSGAVPITLISRSWVTVGDATTDRRAA